MDNLEKQICDGGILIIEKVHSTPNNLRIVSELKHTVCKHFVEGVIIECQYLGRRLEGFTHINYNAHCCHNFSGDEKKIIFYVGKL